MNYATIKNCDIANGPGVRVSLFVSGCTHHCKGCFNAQTWDFNFDDTSYCELCINVTLNAYDHYSSHSSPAINDSI